MITICMICCNITDWNCPGADFCKNMGTRPQIGRVPCSQVCAVGKLRYKKKKPTPASVDCHFFLSPEVLPPADDRVALTVDHVVNVDTGELVCHTCSHILSFSFLCQYSTLVPKMQEEIFPGPDDDRPPPSSCHRPPPCAILAVPSYTKEG